MAVAITAVQPGTPAHRAGLRAGDTLLTIDGHDIEDVLDYRFYMTETRLTLRVRAASGEEMQLDVKKGEYEELGLQFATYLMDEQRRCKNGCVFCFIDQLPAGLRESLYFKDDDARMSFLFGNYITLTNLRERDIERIIAMHISPVNVSVHTTNPALRAEMMRNKHAGEALGWLPRLAKAGIRINAQLVLCPGLNDGAELERSLRDLCALAPGLQSVAVVPVGLTKHRDGLAALRPFSAAEAAAVVDMIERYGEDMRERHGARICYAADEFYLLAGRELPGYEYYGDFDQLENGVGLWALLREEFGWALDDAKALPGAAPRRVTVATGVAAKPLLEELCAAAADRFPHLRAEVVAVHNELFGELITVAGLVAGGDLLKQLRGRELGDAVIIPAVMLRHERDLFLDSLSLDELQAALGVPVIPAENSGDALLEALLGPERLR